MKLKYRLQRLAAKLPPPDRTEAQKRWEDVQDRFCRLLGQAEDLFSPEEEDAVEQGFRPLTEGRVLEGPYGRWLRDLRDSCCRLPKLPAAAMKALLLAWLTPGVTGGVTCKGCGQSAAGMGRARQADRARGVRTVVSSFAVGPA